MRSLEHRSPKGPTLLLITASSPEIRRVRRPRVLNFQQVTMPYLAAFVPCHWTVFHIDEAVDPVDLEMQADLVAITFHTPSALMPIAWRTGSGSERFRSFWADPMWR